VPGQALQRSPPLEPVQGKAVEKERGGAAAPLHVRDPAERRRDQAPRCVERRRIQPHRLLPSAPRRPAPRERRRAGHHGARTGNPFASSRDFLAAAQERWMTFVTRLASQAVAAGTCARTPTPRCWRSSSRGSCSASTRRIICCTTPRRDGRQSPRWRLCYLLTAHPDRVKRPEMLPSASASLPRGEIQDHLRVPSTGRKQTWRGIPPGRESPIHLLTAKRREGRPFTVAPCRTAGVKKVRIGREREFVHPRVASVATCAGGEIFADSFTVIACCWVTRGDAG
jgi:hypothetical protein